MMKLNLRDGASIDSSHPFYVSPGPEGLECGAMAPDNPHYRCTRKRGHQKSAAADASSDSIALDHAAHGGRSNATVMYARWTDAESRNGDGSDG